MTWGCAGRLYCECCVGCLPVIVIGLVNQHLHTLCAPPQDGERVERNDNEEKGKDDWVGGRSQVAFKVFTQQKKYTRII